MKTQEFNFDGMVGPTHNYAGLSFGNVASSTHKSKTSHPRAAALQGLAKMKFVRDLGVGQCVLPPLLRPNLATLRALGFSSGFGFADDPDSDLVQMAYELSPELLASCYSASNMWTANAAMVSPSVDCRDGRLHLTPANLTSKLHRSIEATDTAANLRAIFANEKHFCVHAPLPSAVALSDEGAANFLRLCPNHADQGMEIFVWGRSDFGNSDGNFGPLVHPKKFPARQTLESCHTIILNHGLLGRHYCFQQNPDAIDAGVFHNDVISVANENVLLAHELTFAHGSKVKARIEEQYARFDSPLHYIEFSEQEISLADTVKSYLFNSQLVTREDRGMTLICPNEVKETDSARKCTERIVQESNPVDAVEFLDLRQSMNNGGGPACLRLRIVMTPEEQQAMHQGVILTDKLYDQLVDHVKQHYREDLNPEDLRDPKLMFEARDAHQGLMKILGLKV